MLRLEVRRKPVPGRADVLSGLSLSAERGEIVALAGPSGCGKTTTLRIVAGLERNFEGSLDWPGGRPARIGTVFQEARLLPWRTVAENIAFVRPPRPAAAAAWLDRLGLGGTARLYPAALSGGMARRVALARAMATEPELLLLDEPFTALDAATAETCREAVLQHWRASPCTILLVTHDPAEAAALADRVVLLPGAGRPSVTRVVPPELRRCGIGAGERVAETLLRDHAS